MESILPYLPLDSSLSWPRKAEDILKEIQQGSLVSSKHLVKAICDIRDALSFSPDSISKSTFSGINFFFDEVMTPVESIKWFKELFPKLANLLLKLPSLLEANQNQKLDIHGDGATVTATLRILEPQQPGIVCLSQELIAALLACALFCLFPDHDRRGKDLPNINFNEFFAQLYDHRYITQEDKIWCILIYFERITKTKPCGKVSFERKVLEKKDYAKLWSQSVNTLCKFEVCCSGHIEDQSSKAVEVYFSGKNFGIGALGRGTTREEIRFMLSPELIAGMLFLPAMEDNEAIEIVGVERFSTYEGYKASFRYSADYEDETGQDTFGRRKTRIVAVNELCTPKNNKYTDDIYLCEVNKAFIGFLDQCKDQCGNIGVATGVWEFYPSRKDPEMKAIITWLAASEAKRHFITYCTFGAEELQSLVKVTSCISRQKWTVGDLWQKLIEYSTGGTNTNAGFFQYCFQPKEDPSMEMN